MCETELGEIGEEKGAYMPLTEVDLQRRHITVTKRLYCCASCVQCMNVSSLLRAVAQSIQRPHIKEESVDVLWHLLNVNKAVSAASQDLDESAQWLKEVTNLCHALDMILNAMDGWTVEDRSISHQREAETISGEQESSSPIEGEGQRGVKKRKKAKNRQEKVKKQKKAEASARRSTEKLPLILTAKGMKKHVISRVRPVGDGT